MKALILLVTFGFGMTAHAADVESDNINNQQLSRRPYSQVPTESKNVNFEGTVLIIDESKKDPKHEPMRLHMLGRQPYAVKNTD